MKVCEFMNTVVLKFGGSSVADNIKLNIAAEKIIDIKKDAKNVVVVVSAQGKTTDQLIKDAHELSAVPNEREMDMLLSTGEQISASRLSILLNRKGYKAISLSGWQAGIMTNDVHQNARIEQIATARIEQELENGYIVVVAGFQGIQANGDVTTLGRGGSDTTAVALQVALNAEKCYIFSDVDGIYSADPNMVTIAKKLSEISFDEMQEISDAGAKVLHNRCVQIAKKFDCDITAASTFSNEKGTTICKKIENTEVKSIVKNEKLILIHMVSKESKCHDEALKIYNELLGKNIIIESFESIGKENVNIRFRINVADKNKVFELLDEKYNEYIISKKEIVKISIVGFGIVQDNTILTKVTDILNKNNMEVLNFNLTQSKIEVVLRSVENDILEELHKALID